MCVKRSSVCLLSPAHESQGGMCNSRRFREGCVLQQQSLLYFSLGKMATGYVRVQLWACVFLCSLLAALPVSVRVQCGPNMTSVERVAAGLQLWVEVISRISARPHSLISLRVDGETLAWQCYLLFPHRGAQTPLRPLCEIETTINPTYIFQHAFLAIFCIYINTIWLLGFCNMWRRW